MEAGAIERIEAADGGELYRSEVRVPGGEIVKPDEGHTSLSEFALEGRGGESGREREARHGGGGFTDVPFDGMEAEGAVGEVGDAEAAGRKFEGPEAGCKAPMGIWNGRGIIMRPRSFAPQGWMSTI